MIPPGLREAGGLTQAEPRVTAPQISRVFVVVPAYNEAQNLPRMLAEVNRTLSACEATFQFLVVNDGSQDATAEVVGKLAKTLPIMLLQHPKNHGVGAVFRTGLAEACAQAQPDDAIIILEADGTNDPRALPQMLERIRQGDDIVIGSRYRAGGGYHRFPLRRLVLSCGANLLMRGFFPIAGVRDYTIFCRAYRAGLLQRAFEQYGDRLIERQTFACNAEILIKLQALRPRASEVPMHYRYDLKRGRSKLAIQRTIKEYVALMVAIRRAAGRERRVRSMGRRAAPLGAFLRTIATPRVVLGVVMVATVWLGAHGMMADLPQSRVGAEQKHIQLAVKYGSGDLNPHSFDHPPLLSYVLFALYGVVFLVGRAVGWFHSAMDFEQRYFTDPTLFYVTARVFILGVSAATIPLFYAIARRLCGGRPALMATVWMAVSPVVIIWSHYATPTIPLLFMCLVSLYWTVQVLQRGRFWDSALAGFFGGLAIATKYDAGLLLVPLAAAHLLATHQPRRVMMKRLGVAIIAIVMGFFIGCPFSLLDIRAFFMEWKTLLYEELVTSGSGRALLPMFLVDKPGWLYILLDAWPTGWGAPLTIVGLIGLAAALRRPRREDIFLGSLVVAAYIFIGSWQSIAPRYFIAVVPFLLLLGARWLSKLVEACLRSPAVQSGALCALTGVLALAPAWNSLTFDRLVSQRSAHLRAKDWIEATIPSGTIIATSASLPLTPNARSINRRLERITARHLGQGIYLRHLLQHLGRAPATYELLDLPWPWRADYDRADYDFAHQMAQGMQYAVLTDELAEYAKAPQDFQDQLRFFRHIQEQCTLLKEFEGPLLFQESRAYTQEERVQIYRCR